MLHIIVADEATVSDFFCINIYNPYLPEVGYNIPQACLVAKLSQLPTFEKSVVPHD